MSEWRVLVVDDEIGMLEVCRDTLCTIDGVDIDLEASSECAVKRLEQRSWDLLIVDIRMPGVSGLELLEIARRQDPQLPVLIMTAYPTVDTAVESMKRGAADYIVKPFLPDDLRETARRLLTERRLRDENELLSTSLERRHAFGDIVGGSMAMRAVFDAIERVAATDVDVLVTGETGTGKDLFARAVHYQSARKSKPFVPVNCAALPDHLVENELFGHSKGAFTDAGLDHKGLLAEADGGTLFLDEINSLSLLAQGKLLRFPSRSHHRCLSRKSELFQGC